MCRFYTPYCSHCSLLHLTKTRILLSYNLELPEYVSWSSWLIHIKRGPSMAARTGSALCRSLRLHTSLVQRLDLQRDIFQISRPMLKFHLQNVRYHDGVLFHARAHKIHLRYRGLSDLIFDLHLFSSSVYLTFETRYSFQRRAFYIIPYKILNEENYFLWPTADTTP